MKLFCSILFILYCSCSSAQISKIEVDSVIRGMKKIITEDYVITANAKSICDSLNAANYENIENEDVFVKKLNDDLFRYSNDKHLFIQYNREVATNLANHKDIHHKQDLKEKRDHYGFDKPEILNDNIGYLKIRYFANAKNATKEITKKIKAFSNTKALILDLRNNLGGNGTMLQLLTAYFFEEDTIKVLGINYKSGNNVYLKSQIINQQDKYLHKPIYILINKNTFSAGEAFAFIMKNRKRAVLLGETTAGAGNVAGPHAINEKYLLTVPAGIVMDPFTNTSWEQIGVVPDYPISPESALDKALELCKNIK